MSTKPGSSSRLPAALRLPRREVSGLDVRGARELLCTALRSLRSVRALPPFGWALAAPLLLCGRRSGRLFRARRLLFAFCGAFRRPLGSVWPLFALLLAGAALAAVCGAGAAFFAGRSGVASGALTKCGSNFGWALLPRFAAGALFPSRRGRLLLERRFSLRPPGVRFWFSSMDGPSFGSDLIGSALAATVFSFFSLAGFSSLAAFSAFAAGCSVSAFGLRPRTGGSVRTGAGTPSHGWPDTTGMLLRFSFSMPARYSFSSGAQKLTAVPSAPARAVRPMRWT